MVWYAASESATGQSGDIKNGGPGLFRALTGIKTVQLTAHARGSEIRNQNFFVKPASLLLGCIGEFHRSDAEAVEQSSNRRQVVE
jgi:hypothetical protein